jgi:hypothetical protein
MRFGMQFYPLPAAPATAAYAKRAMAQHPFERLCFRAAVQRQA